LRPGRESCTRDGGKSAYFCGQNVNCPGAKRESIRHFASKALHDIDGLGDKCRPVGRDREVMGGSSGPISTGWNGMRQLAGLEGWGRVKRRRKKPARNRGSGARATAGTFDRFINGTGIATSARARARRDRVALSRRSTRSAGKRGRLDGQFPDPFGRRGRPQASASTFPDEPRNRKAVERGLMESLSISKKPAREGAATQWRRSAGRDKSFV